MKADDIVKALRLCGETTECISERIGCLYRENTDDCKRELLFDAADIIEAQQQEIEDWKDAGTVASKHNKELKQEIIRHIAEIEMDNVAIDNFVADKDKLAGRIMQLEQLAKDLYFAYINKDADCPHSFETQAVEAYKKMIGGKEYV